MQTSNTDLWREHFRSAGKGLSGIGVWLGGCGEELSIALYYHRRPPHHHPRHQYPDYKHILHHLIHMTTSYLSTLQHTILIPTTMGVWGEGLSIVGSWGCAAAKGNKELHQLLRCTLCTTVAVERTKVKQLLPVCSLIQCNLVLWNCYSTSTHKREIKFNKFAVK